MRFSLRTLLIFMLLAGPLSAVGWRKWTDYCARLEREAAREANSIQAQRTVMTMTIGNFAPPSPNSKFLEQYQSNISWESFPESQPPQP